MTHGSLFSGIGGFDLSAEWMGWENKFHCEWNPFGQKILKHYWPDAISYTDITKTDFSIHRGEIDIITGGFPCQPYSQAGKRKGKADERHLWPEMLRAIREVQPSWVVGENVPGLLNWEGGMVLHEIKTDLEGAGFEVFPPCILPACGKDAPHRRDRLWIVAYSKSNIVNNENRDEKSGTQEISKKRFNESNITSNSSSIGQSGSGKSKQPIYSKKDKNGEANRFNGANEINVTHSIKIGLSDQEQIRELARRRHSLDYVGNVWEKFPTQPPVCNGDDGVPTGLDIKVLSKREWREESIKA